MGGETLVLQQAYKGQRIRKEWKIPLDATVILSVGEVNRNKNHRIGIEVLAKLNDKNVYYVICGRGPLVEEYKKLAQSLGVEDRVILTGYRTDVSSFYKMADVFLFPSFREGLPVALMEAMASGLPVIATKIRGSSDLVEQGGLFDPNDSNGIAQALKNISAKKNKYSVERFDIEQIMEKMKEIYQV